MVSEDNVVMIAVLPSENEVVASGMARHGSLNGSDNISEPVGVMRHQCRVATCGDRNGVMPVGTSAIGRGNIHIAP